MAIGALLRGVLLLLRWCCDTLAVVGVVLEVFVSVVSVVVWRLLRGWCGCFCCWRCDMLLGFAVLWGCI